MNKVTKINVKHKNNRLCTLPSRTNLFLRKYIAVWASLHIITLYALSENLFTVLKHQEVLGTRLKSLKKPHSFVYQVF